MPLPKYLECVIKDTTKWRKENTNFVSYMKEFKKGSEEKNQKEEKIEEEKKNDEIVEQKGKQHPLAYLFEDSFDVEDDHYIEDTIAQYETNVEGGRGLRWGGMASFRGKRRKSLEDQIQTEY